MRHLLISILAAAMAGPIYAADCSRIRDDAERLACFDSVRACAAITSDTDRLACFDAAHNVADTKDADGNAGSMQEAVGDAAGPVELHSSPEDFAARKSPVTESDEIEATIVEVTRDALKIDYLLLDNGHVWRENEDSRVRFKVGRKVTINEGILGSFNLTMDGTTKSVKVKRVE